MCGKLKAPFPYFGGKSRIADTVWDRFGEVRNYVEPFAGSLAVLLSRPQPFSGAETVNDADGYVANFWRAMVHDAEGVAEWAEWPVNEADLHARHLWLLRLGDDLTSRLMADPDWYDVKIAGWWVWGLSAWIGSGFCSGAGPWTEVDGEFVKIQKKRNSKNSDNPSEIIKGVTKQIPNIGSLGKGIHRTSAISNSLESTRAWDNLEKVAERMRYVRVACGDWSRVCGNSATYGLGVTGIFLDPPYSEGEIDYNAGGRFIGDEVRAWCKKHTDNPKMRMALCGYGSDHSELEELGWTVVDWKAHGGYGNHAKEESGPQGRANSFRERIWFSPHCLNP